MTRGIEYIQFAHKGHTIESFKEWLACLESIVPLKKFKKIKKGLQKKIKPGNKTYKPGTFGVEIEFKVTPGETDEEFIWEKLYSDSDVWDDFQKEVDHPPTVEMWEQENPEPEQAYWKKDLVANYYEINGFEQGMPIPYPEDLNQAIEDDMSPTDPLFPLVRFRNLWNRGFYDNVFPKIETPIDIDDYNDVMRLINKIVGSTPIRLHVPNINKYLKQFWEFHNDNMKNLNQEEWEETIEDQYQDEFEKWEEKKDEVQEEWDNWANSGESEAFSDFVQEIIYNRDWEQYIGEEPGDVQGKIDEYVEKLNEIGIQTEEGDAEGTTWGVGEDASGVVEIRTGILTTKDIPKLKQVLIMLSGEKLTNDTSAHVHIGMPENTDAFDLIAMTTLADEKQIKATVPKRAFRDFAQLRPSISNELIYQIGKSNKSNYTSEELLEKISMMGRDFGTNLLAFKRHGTVEFRYLSSEVVANPEKLFQWIQYYLILPQIAQGRKQIVVTNNKGQKMIMTRMPNGMVNVSMDGRPSQPSEPPSELRSQTLNPFQQKKMEFKLTKTKIASLLDDKQNPLPLDVRDSIYYAVEKAKTPAVGSGLLSPIVVYLKDIWPFLNQKNQEYLIKRIER